MIQVKADDIVNIVLDTETLGIPKNRCIILSLGATYFTDDELFNMPARDITSKMFLERGMYVKFDKAEQKKIYGRIAERDTVDWWKKQGKEAKIVLHDDPIADRELLDGFRDLYDWVGDHPPKKIRFWARGLNFDMHLIETCMDDVGISRVMAFWNYRDTRTWCGGAMLDPNMDRVPIGTSRMPSFVAHHSLYDATKDAIMCMLAPRYASGSLDMPTDNVIPDTVPRNRT